MERWKLLPRDEIRDIPNSTYIYPSIDERNGKNDNEIPDKYKSF